MIKILADENVHSDIVRGLRNAGYDLLYVAEIGLAGSSDERVLEYAIKHDRILTIRRQRFRRAHGVRNVMGKG